MRALLSGLVAGLVWCQAVGAAHAEDAVTFKVLKLEGNNVNWHRTGQVAPVVTYGLVSATANFPGARNCRKMTSLEGLTSASGIETAAVRGEIAAAFAMWQAVANITFREVSEPARADILIGAQGEPEGWAFADVFYNAQSPETIKPISRSLICLNPVKRWKIGFDGNLKTYDLRYTIAHEIGHAIGLDHPSGAGTIMGYRYEERFRQLQAGDVQGAIALYGPRTPAERFAADAEPRTQAPASDALRQSSGGTRALNPRSQ